MLLLRLHHAWWDDEVFQDTKVTITSEWLQEWSTHLEKGKKMNCWHICKYFINNGMYSIVNTHNFQNDKETKQNFSFSFNFQFLIIGILKSSQTFSKSNQTTNIRIDFVISSSLDKELISLHPRRLNKNLTI